jgi:very-short-patch-repair endonuclease
MTKSTVTRNDIQKFRKWKFARTQRCNPTEAEVKVWDKLRMINYQLPKGVVWRRQVCVGNYVIDFLCERSKIGLEVDGSSHRGKEEYDYKRQNFLVRAGYEIVHVSNLDVNDGVLLESFVEALMGKTLFRLNKYNR